MRLQTASARKPEVGSVASSWLKAARVEGRPRYRRYSLKRVSRPAGGAVGACGRLTAPLCRAEPGPLPDIPGPCGSCSPSS
eukprot:scaffold646441_cov43-Prasinocladus_malaysianus.AAC.1